MANASICRSASRAGSEGRRPAEPPLATATIPAAGCWLLGIVAMGSLVVGCAPRPKRDVSHPVWPAPPAAPRIVHRLTIISPDDLGSPGLLEGIGRAIVGKHPIQFQQPSAVALDADRRLFVADLKLQGIHVLHFGSTKYRFLDRAGKQYFVSPVGLAWCGDRLAVADSVLKKVFILSPEGRLLDTLDKPGGFSRPTGLAWDPAGQRLFVADTLANEICVFDRQGKLVLRKGSAGKDVGQFNFPTHLFIDRSGRLFVTDSMNFRIQVFDAQMKYLFDLGRHGDASGHLGVPKGLAVDSLGHLYVVDSYFSVVQVFDQTGRFLLRFGQPGNRNGQFQVPTAMAIDAQDRLFLCDGQNHRVQVFQYVGGADHESPPKSRP